MKGYNEAVSKHPAVAAERFLASLAVVWVRWELVSDDVNLTGHAQVLIPYKQKNPVSCC